MQSCSVCYTENPDGLQYCEACGSELASAQDTHSYPSLPDLLPLEPSTLDPTPHQYPAQEFEQPSWQSSNPPLPQIPDPIHGQPVPRIAPEAQASPTLPSDMQASPLPSIASSPGGYVSGGVEPPHSPMDPLPSSGIPPFPGHTPSSSRPKAKLILKNSMGLRTEEFNQREYSIDRKTAKIGCFDPETGPVDINLEGIPGSEQVSRQHGELKWDGHHWVIRDLGSTNGIFLRSPDADAWSNRITVPTPIYNGYEVAIGPVFFDFETSLS